MNQTKTPVVLLFGGRSSEHSISCVTAAGVLGAIDRSKFTVVPVGITKRGATVLLDECQIAEFSLAAATLPEVPDNGTRVSWPDDIGNRNLTITHPDGTRQVICDIAAVLPLLHGPYGEDGSVQGLFELIDLPYAGSGILASALCMHKHMCKTVLAGAGVPVAPWRTITRAQVQANPELLPELVADLRYPIFVKPARAGSSVGVSRITQYSELAAALELAFASDTTVLLESAISGREVEVAVLAGRDGAAPRCSAVLGEILCHGREFYDFEAKYRNPAAVELVVPAQVSAAELAAIQQAAITAFTVTECDTLARIDFFLTADGPVLNEINTLPGFTPLSMYPQLWEASGLSYTDLISELIALTLAKTSSY